MNRKRILAFSAIMAFGTLTSQAAQADDWGCQVLLCLSDPRGPTAQSECVPPISKLWRHLRKSRGFPSCAMVGNTSTREGTFAERVYEPFDLCPEGLEVAAGWIATGGSKDQASWDFDTRQFSNIKKRLDEDDHYSQSQQRACVGKELGSHFVNGDRDNNGYHIRIFDEVVWQRRKSPRAIDVYIDGLRHNRVHY